MVVRINSGGQSTPQAIIVWPGLVYVIVLMMDERDMQLGEILQSRVPLQQHHVVT